MPGSDLLIAALGGTLAGAAFEELPMTHWSAIVGMAAVTYLLRAAPLLAPARHIDMRIGRRLRYLPPALFAALIVPSLLAPAGTLQGGVRLWAGLIGLSAGWFTRSIPITIIVGLGVYALLRWLGV